MGEFYRAREPQLSLIPVDLNKIVNQVLDLTRARWSDMVQQRGAIDVRLELAKTCRVSPAVECQVRDALVNLVFNAVDAMPQGGPLTLRTRVAADSGGQIVQLEVADAGTGMDEDTRRRCLEPFFTTKGARGTGLGLAMVYGVVQRHNANLEIESEPGKGTWCVSVSRRHKGPRAVQRLPPAGRGADARSHHRRRSNAVEVATRCPGKRRPRRHHGFRRTGGHQRLRGSLTRWGSRFRW